MTDAGGPIVVNANPAVDQIQAGLRLTIVAAGSVAGALGFVRATHTIDGLLLAVGPVAALIAYVWALVKTRTLSLKASSMAAMLPFHVAQTK